MTNVVTLPSAALTPTDLLRSLEREAENMRAVVVVSLGVDGTWCVAHSTTQQSVIDSAAINLLKYVSK